MMSADISQEQSGSAPARSSAAWSAEAAEHHYDASVWERPSVTVDVVILSLQEGDLKVLLIKRRNWPYEGYWAIPGGFIEMRESLEESARRELEEETGLRDIYMEQLYTFGDPGRDPRTRVITVAYLALVDYRQLHPQAADDAGSVGWFSMYDLPSLGFDHAQILDYTLKRLRGKLEYTTIGFQFLPPTFTLSELQQVYQVILGQERKLDKRNFRKKIVSTGILESTGEMKMEGTHRPARLYRFNPKAEA
ncbi:MAG TPA: NUDIX domain-containing protein [Ktedonobacterales bacterium]|jgi:8-oxo-dGTP diphosphatase